MSEIGESSSRIKTETVVIGDASSRLSTAIFLLLCLVPVFTTILFGAVDSATWVILSIVWLTMVLLWLAEAWRGGGFLLDPSSL